MDSIKIFRQNSALECSCWPAKHKVILEIAPAYPDKPKGQPQPGSKLYDYTKKIKISFGPNDILKFRYALLKHSNGEAEDYKKMADMSKVAGSTDTDKKSLGVNLNANACDGFQRDLRIQAPTRLLPVQSGTTDQSVPGDSRRCAYP